MSLCRSTILLIVTRVILGSTNPVDSQVKTRVSDLLKDFSLASGTSLDFHVNNNSTMCPDNSRDPSGKCYCELAVNTTVHFVDLQNFSKPIKVHSSVEIDENHVGTISVEMESMNVDIPGQTSVRGGACGPGCPHVCSLVTSLAGAVEAHANVSAKATMKVKGSHDSARSCVNFNFSLTDSNVEISHFQIYSHVVIMPGFPPINDSDTTAFMKIHAEPQIKVALGEKLAPAFAPLISQIGCIPTTHTKGGGSSMSTMEVGEQTETAMKKSGARKSVVRRHQFQVDAGGNGKAE